MAHIVKRARLVPELLFEGLLWGGDVCIYDCIRIWVNIEKHTHKSIYTDIRTYI